MKHLKNLLFSLSLVILYSCTPGAATSDPDVFLKVTKKMTQTDFKKDFEKYINDTTEVSINGNKYYVFYAKMSTYENTETHEVANISYSSRQPGFTSYSTHTRIARRDYIFVFQDNKYLFSGYLYELLRHPNENIKAVGLELFSKIKD